MKAIESQIDLFDNIYGIGEAADITVDYKSENGDKGIIGVYFTVIRRKDSEDIEIYDMRHGRKFIVEGTFIGVCTLLGLSLDPMALDPVSVTDDSIDPIDGDIFGSYTVTMENGKWVDYDIDFDEEAEKCREEIRNVWDSYQQAPDMIEVYNR